MITSSHLSTSISFSLASYSHVEAGFRFGVGILCAISFRKSIHFFERVAKSQTLLANPWGKVLLFHSSSDEDSLNISPYCSFCDWDRSWPSFSFDVRAHLEIHYWTTRLCNLCNQHQDSFSYKIASHIRKDEEILQASLGFESFSPVYHVKNGDHHRFSTLVSYIVRLQQQHAPVQNPRGDSTNMMIFLRLQSPKLHRTSYTNLTFFLEIESSIKRADSYKPSS